MTMSVRSSFGFGAAWFSALVFVSGCSGAPEVSEGPAPSSEEPIIGGEPTDATKYQSVGALAWTYPGYGVLHVFCTGTLASETSIVTARHCTPSIDEAFYYGLVPAFVFGPDAYNPTQIVPITGYVAAPASPTSPGLLLDGGRDVAVAYLESQPIDVEPIVIARFTKDMVTEKFQIVGYGVHSPDEHLTGQKYAGKITGRAIRGRWYKLLFDGDYDAYEDWYFTDSSATTPTEEGAKEWWKIYELEKNYELLAGGVPGEPVGCYGDSGGPLFGKDAKNRLRLYGVGFATESTQSTICGLGNGYLVFNDEMLEFVSSNL